MGILEQVSAPGEAHAWRNAATSVSQYECDAVYRNTRKVCGLRERLLAAVQFLSVLDSRLAYLGVATIKRLGLRRPERSSRT